MEAERRERNEKDTAVPALQLTKNTLGLREMGESGAPFLSFFLFLISIQQLRLFAPDFLDVFQIFGSKNLENMYKLA